MAGGVRYGAVSSDKVRYGAAGKAGRVPDWQVPAGYGTAGLVWQGKFGLGPERTGKAGKAVSGVYWRGKVRRGPVRFGWHVVARSFGERLVPVRQARIG